MINQATSIYSRRKTQWLLGAFVVTVVVLALATILPRIAAQSAAAQSATVPTFTIEDVVTDNTVTIKTADFPPYQDFVVRMGPNGTLGIDGQVVGHTNSGEGGSFTATYSIPASLQGAQRIAIRLESAKGYYAYNWFYNNLETPKPRVPSFTIESVIPDQMVTIHAYNFPANRSFLVTMGHMGTDAIDGVAVGTIDTGSGGELLASFNIPVSLRGLERIAIRAESGPYYAYNWFNNLDLSNIPTPTMRICAVVRDESITIVTRDTFPANREFALLMNFMGTLGTGGYVTGTFNSGPTGVYSGTFPIPEGLRGLDQIAVRADEINGPYYSYNYVNNQTATYCTTPTP
ncbi:MAG: hypothetical protein R3C44_19770 [Chloroflexota bacterium]